MTSRKEGLKEPLLGSENVEEAVFGSEQEQAEPPVGKIESSDGTTSKAKKTCPVVMIAVILVFVLLAAGGVGAYFFLWAPRANAIADDVVLQCGAFPLANNTPNQEGMCNAGDSECEVVCAVGYFPDSLNTGSDDEEEEEQGEGGGPMLSVCSSGAWDPPFLACHTCPPPQLLPHSTVVRGCAVGNVTCSVKCQDGWFPEAGDDGELSCDDGTAWLPELSPCHTCPLFEVPTRASVAAGCSEGDVSCTVACDDGWFADDNTLTAACDDGTAWMPVLGCHTCPSFTLKDHAHIVSGCSEGDLTCTIECDEGWFSDTNVPFTCNNGISWSPFVLAAEYCHTCPVFTLPSNASVQEGCSEGDLHCAIECDLGFRPSNGLQAECDGVEWFPSLQCEAIEWDINFLALGDWGTVDDTNHTSSTQGKSEFNSERYNEDFNSQEFIGYLMGQWAEKHNADFVLGQGDNFYWNGVTSVDAPEWETTFEQRYPNPALHIPWYNVMGEHDYGGGSNIEGGRDALITRLNAQRQYSSPHSDRWHLDDYYYTVSHTFQHPSNPEFSFTTQIFNIDGNAAPNRGYNSICCQTYGYVDMGCEDMGCIGDAGYRGGCAPVEQVLECRELLEQMFDDSLTFLERDLQASTADWKIVNSHYAPRMHMSGDQQERIYAILEEGGVQAYFYGHTHGEGHEYRNGIHYFMNGAGGGMRRNGGDGAVWALEAYAFIGVQLAKEIMQVRFFGFGEGWGNFNGTQVGAERELHCWSIPAQASELVGSEC